MVNKHINHLIKAGDSSGKCRHQDYEPPWEYIATPFARMTGVEATAAAGLKTNTTAAAYGFPRMTCGVKIQNIQLVLVVSCFNKLKPVAKHSPDATFTVV
jgi:hypothetical protein